MIALYSTLFRQNAATQNKYQQLKCIHTTSVFEQLEHMKLLNMATESDKQFNIVKLGKDFI